MDHLKRTLSVLATAVIVIASSASADDGGFERRREFDSRPLTSKWTVKVGGSLNSFDTRIAWSPEGLTGGAVIHAEDTLGLAAQNSTFTLGAVYRFDRRHSLEFSVTDVRRSAVKTIDQEIEWGDYVYRANGELASKFDMTITSLRYRFDFSDSGRLNAGFSAGLSTYSVDASIVGEARLEDDFGAEWVEGVVEGADVLAPVPMVGFFLDYATTPKLILLFSAEVIDLNVGDHSGRILETDIALEYAVTDLVGAGIVMNAIDLRYSKDEASEILSFEYEVKSIGAYVTFVF